MALDAVSDDKRNGQVMVKVRSAIHLSKIHLSGFAAISSLFGWALTGDTSIRRGVVSTLAVFLLACGCSTLNNIQDRYIDGQFDRTRHRPLPSGRVSVRFARVQAWVLFGVSCLMLHLCSETLVPLLSGAGVIGLYNGCYTPLKRKTRICLIPGVLCGTAGPWIGWSVAGTSPPDIIILWAMVLFGVWQLPHTWLVTLTHYSDYSKTALPGFQEVFTPASLSKLVVVWSAGLLVLMTGFAWVAVTVSPTGRLLIVTCAGLLMAGLLAGVVAHRLPRFHSLFVTLNATLLFLMTVCITDGFWWRMQL